ncbi:hypothetical protein PR202_ga24404 [Eleusine coracana subsp. coracana]|uniref:Protein kinase domain-containing protein n=1 Tax=Eleusine coracana subsp. coracana TaxID=191504 RepID=A0AAV5D8R6_ELECO|nr:hypothetical protein PR202_ga24404 [Eleusine coracana subsp. coracana]
MSASPSARATANSGSTALNLSHSAPLFLSAVRSFSILQLFSRGYLAPEYLYRGEISPQSDIYSLGMLLIQISTGEKNKSNTEDKCGAKFIEQVRQEWTDHKITSMYASLGAGHLQEIKRCIEIGLQCVEVDRKKRPTIKEIIDKLNGKR